MAARKLGPVALASGLAITVGAAALAPVAQAQGSACEQLKDRLATRLSADPGTYVLEAVPAGTPPPPGGKFIGTCEGGAKKILYRKPTGQPAVTAASPSTATPAATVAPAALPPARHAEPVALAAQPASAPVAPAAEVTIEEPPAEPSPVTAPASSGPGLLARAKPWATAHWPWLAALLALPLLGFGWAWLAHRRAYDEAGLPRGPRLRP